MATIQAVICQIIAVHNSEYQRPITRADIGITLVAMKRVINEKSHVAKVLAGALVSLRQSNMVSPYRDQCPLIQEDQAPVTMKAGYYITALGLDFLSKQGKPHAVLPSQVSQVRG